ncbi:hypothetical protein NE237_022065 [Protea cynaroides]|uniref:Uncharacterized protein n=1 Tax=Protea cynaroides TaxID=273540 RepID=A0A9Q0GKS7_9MAGN|nr:hypothetical protein NE237_022065 [Protea cynaroides]
MTSGRYKVHLFRRGRTTEIFRSACVGAAQTKKSLVRSECRPGPPSAARSGNGARRGRRYAPQLCCGRPPDYAKESRDPLQLATTGARPARPEWAQRSAPIRMELGGLSLLPDLERYYESSVPDSIAAAIWFTGTTKKSHAYVTDVSIISDHEDPGRASGFHSHHHIDDKSPRALP